MSDDLSPCDAALVGSIARAFRQGTVEALLAGNDTGCFTTEQYAAEYIRQDHCSLGDSPERRVREKDWWVKHHLAEKHLRSLPDLVREVKPGVWAAIGG